MCGKRPSNLLQSFFIFAEYFVAKKTFSRATHLQLIWCVDAACFASYKCVHLMITVKIISSEETLCWRIFCRHLLAFLNFSTSSKLNLLDIFHPTVENSKIIQNHTNRFNKKRRYRRSHEVYSHVHLRTMCCILEPKNPNCLCSSAYHLWYSWAKNPKSVLFNPTVEN